MRKIIFLFLLILKLNAVISQPSKIISFCNNKSDKNKDYIFLNPIDSGKYFFYIAISAKNANSICSDDSFFGVIAFKNHEAAYFDMIGNDSIVIKFTLFPDYIKIQNNTKQSSFEAGTILIRNGIYKPVKSTVTNIDFSLPCMNGLIEDHVIAQDRAYFYSLPDSLKKTNIYIEKGDKINSYIECEGYKFCTFKNTNTGKIYKGWILKTSFNSER